MGIKNCYLKLKTLISSGNAPAKASVDAAALAQLDFIDRTQLTHFFEKDPLVELYELAFARTGAIADSFLKTCRFIFLAQLCEIALRKHAEGDIAECGCWRGHSAYMIATLATRHGFKNVFHIFDSFEGLSELAPEDISKRLNLNADQILEQAKWFACSEDVVKENLSEFSFIQTHKGWVPDRFSDVANKKFLFVHIDLDLYKPIADSVDFFYPRMLPNGIIAFDDYGSARFPGAEKAIDEAVKKFKPSFFFKLPTGGAFLIV